MKLKIKNKTDMIIPKQLDYILKLQKRKDAEERIIKVYEALLYKKSNKFLVVNVFFVTKLSL